MTSTEPDSRPPQQPAPRPKEKVDSSFLRKVKKEIFEVSPVHQISTEMMLRKKKYENREKYLKLILKTE